MRISVRFAKNPVHFLTGFRITARACISFSRKIIEIMKIIKETIRETANPGIRRPVRHEKTRGLFFGNLRSRADSRRCRKKKSWAKVFGNPKKGADSQPFFQKKFMGESVRESEKRVRIPDFFEKLLHDIKKPIGKSS